MTARGKTKFIELMTTGTMQANGGDQVVVKGRRIGEPNRTGEVLEARGPCDRGPFLVRWADDGHVSLLFPGTDTIVDYLHRGETTRLPTLVS